MVRVGDTNDYFHRSREWHPLVTEEVARFVAESGHSTTFPPRKTDGRVEIFGYHPKLKARVAVVAIPVGGPDRHVLHNGYAEWNHKEEIRNRARRHGWR